MIVVDTNILASICLADDNYEKVLGLLKREPVWNAPFLWRSEMANLLATHIRIGRFQLMEARRMFNKAIEIVREHEYEVDHLDVLELANESGLSGYDCEFVYLAKH